MPTPSTKGKKRTAPQSAKPNKKPRLNHGGSKPMKKERAFERPTIPIPVTQDDSDVSDEDIEFFQENGGAGQFLQSIDLAGIARSKKETERLFSLSKVPYKTREVKAQPLIKDSPGDENSDWSSGIEELDSIADDSEVSEASDSEGSMPSSLEDSDEEQSYERKPRVAPGQDEVGRKSVPRLPIKLPGGQVQQTGVREGSIESDDQSDGSSQPKELSEPPKRNITGARFGRAAVADIIRIKSREQRLQAAKEQIAGICQDILSEPEQSLGLLRRLLAFAGPSINDENESGTVTVKNDPTIRQLSVISITAVFKDIAPGYRIRKLSEKELSEKVSQAVGQTRDWEQGLVSIYQSYLQLLEKEIRERTDLLDTCIRCMCTLLNNLTHFNFRTNIMSTLVSRLSRKTWDTISEECLNALIEVFRHDLTGAPSLEAVRLLNRMIKERHFNVHPNVLSCLLHLRLKTELKNVRASSQHADKEQRRSESKAKLRRAKGKGKGEQPHLSKKAKKALKETKAIKSEMDEAEAEVDKEDKANQHTETLKLLFVLYFSILKAAKPSPLLFGALQGIARFAHMVNVDFFRDLLAVIRQIMNRGDEPDEDVDLVESPNGLSVRDQSRLRLQILCVVTAFELLSGQGEALNLDLNDFTIHLYKILPHLAVSSALEKDHSDKPPSTTIVDLLFRALNAILMPKFGKAPSYLLAAFSKRLITLSTQTNPDTTIRALDFVKSLLGNDAKLEALLSTEERMANGIYRDDVDDPQLCNPFAAVWWEVLVLEEQHYDERVRKSAHALRTWRPA